MGRLTDRLKRNDWRRKVSSRALAAAIATAGGMTLATPATFAQANPPAMSPADDAAQKLLLKATGLYNRQLFKLAAADYQQFLTQFPNHAEAVAARFALGVCHYRQAEYEPAIDQLSRVAKDDKFAQRDEALAVVGHSQLAVKKYDAAVAAFDELITRFPQSKQVENAALSKAQALYLANKFQPAADAAAAFQKQFPQSGDKQTAAFFLGLSQKALNQDAAAEATLAALLKDDPKSRFALDATLVLGQALEAQGKLDEAAARFTEMTESAPALRQPEAWYSLGAVRYRQAKYADAATAFKAVLEKSPDGPYSKPAKLQLGLAQLAAGQPAEARKTLTTVAKDDPTHASAARYGLAQCDIADKKFDAAIATLEELLKLQPPPVNAQQISFDRALCLAETGKHDVAATAFEAFISANAKSPLVSEATYRQAYSLHQLTKYDASHSLCAKVIAAEGSEFAGPAKELDAENLFLLGKFPEAAKAYEALAKVEKDEDRANRFNFRLGQCAYSQGDFSKAVELLTPLAAKPKVAQDDRLGRAVFLLGDALLQQGKHAEAAGAFEKYLASLKAGAGEKGDKQEAQYKQAYALLRSTSSGSALPPTVKQLFTTVASGPETSAWTTRAHFELGQLAYQAKPARLDEAQASFKKVMAANGGQPPEDLAAPSLYFLGWVDYDQKKFAPAAVTWADVVKRFPKSPVAPDAAFHRGVALREAADHAGALEAFTAYTAAFPKGAHVVRAKQLSASSLMSLQKPAEAGKLLTSLAADKDSANENVLYDLAWAQKETKDPAAAATTYRRMLKEFPEGKLLNAGRAELAELLVKENKHAEAAELLEPVVAAKDVEPKTRSLAMALLGVAYKGAGKTDKAAEAFAAYAKEFPNENFSGDALLQAGEQSASVGKFADAEKSFADLLKRFPQHPQASLAQLKLAEAQADAGKFAEAQQSHSAFLAKYAKDPLAFRAHFGLGWALHNQKQYEPARAAYAKAIAATNGETAARSQFQIGETYCEEGKFDQAVPALLAVEDVYAYPVWSARALLEAGRAFEQLKQPDQAKKQYETVVTKYKAQADEAKLAAAKLKALGG